MKKTSLILIALSLCVAGCSTSGYETYTCKNGDELRADFGKRQLKWTLKRSGMKFDMDPMQSIGDGVYRSATGTIAKAKNGNIIMNVPESQTVCRIK